jgi:hypothetical protein
LDLFQFENDVGWFDVCHACRCLREIALAKELVASHTNIQEYI